jgi:hypothetical protein
MIGLGHLLPPILSELRAEAKERDLARMGFKSRRERDLPLSARFFFEWRKTLH